MLNHPVERDGRGMDISDRQLSGIARAAHLTINDREYSLEVDPRESLLDVRPERLDLTTRRRAAIRALAHLHRARSRSRNVVHHATGWWIRDLPIRPEMLI
jgi:hypothetical protein